MLNALFGFVRSGSAALYSQCSEHVHRTRQVCPLRLARGHLTGVDSCDHLPQGLCGLSYVVELHTHDGSTLAAWLSRKLCALSAVARPKLPLWGMFGSGGLVAALRTRLRRGNETRHLADSAAYESLGKALSVEGVVPGSQRRVRPG